MTTETTVFVYTINQIGQPGKWSRYIFPFNIDAFVRLGDDLYVRSGDDFLKVDESAVQDYAGDPRAANFEGVVQWAWLDDGTPGTQKMWHGFDIIGQGTPQVAIGYDQSNESAFTTNYTVPADSVPGMLIPMPVMAPSASVRVTYAGGDKWKLQGVNLWLDDMWPTA